MEIGLRPWTMDDVEALARLANDIYVWEHVRDYFPYPYTEEDAGDFIMAVTSKERTEDFAITVEGTVAGGAGFVRQGDVHRLSAEIGYWLGETYRGKGIASVAIGELSKLIFRDTEIIHLFASVFGFNRASMRSLEKAGFSLVGVMHSCVVKNGRLTELHYYEKLKEAPGYF